MKNKKLNVLVLMCDQFALRRLVLFGNPNIATPNIDRLASRSMRFHAAF